MCVKVVLTKLLPYGEHCSDKLLEVYLGYSYIQKTNNETYTIILQVLLAHSLPLKIPSELPCNLHQVRTVANADEKGFVFADGTYSEADAIIYCTGKRSFLSCTS